MIVTIENITRPKLFDKMNVFIIGFQLMLIFNNLRQATTIGNAHAILNFALILLYFVIFFFGWKVKIELYNDCLIAKKGLSFLNSSNFKKCGNSMVLDHSWPSPELIVKINYLNYKILLSNIKNSK